MYMDYSKEITDMFLIRYRELESIQQNNNSKYQYLLNNYRSELDLFRHIRNDLSHDVVDSHYPFNSLRMQKRLFIKKLRINSVCAMMMRILSASGEVNFGESG